MRFTHDHGIGVVYSQKKKKKQRDSDNPYFSSYISLCKLELLETLPTVDVIPAFAICALARLCQEKRWDRKTRR